MSKKADKTPQNPSGTGKTDSSKSGKGPMPPPEKTWLKTHKVREDGDHDRPTEILGIPRDGEDRPS